jgi:hypothetical protein
MYCGKPGIPEDARGAPAIADFYDDERQQKSCRNACSAKRILKNAFRGPFGHASKVTHTCPIDTSFR